MALKKKSDEYFDAVITGHPIKKAEKDVETASFIAVKMEKMFLPDEQQLSTDSTSAKLPIFKAYSEPMPKTQGREGVARTKINMAFSEVNYTYLKKSATENGITITQRINDIVGFVRTVFKDKDFAALPDEPIDRDSSGHAWAIHIKTSISDANNSFLTIRAIKSGVSVAKLLNSIVKAYREF